MLAAFSALKFLILCFVGEAIDHDTRTLLSAKIKNYWPTYIDRQLLMESHQRLINKPEHSSRLAVRFTSYGRSVVLQLKKQTDLFSPSASVLRVDEDGIHRVAFDANEFYVGAVTGKNNSWAHGFVTADGLFEGTFHVVGVRYHIEPASRYSHIDLDEKLFNSVVYSEVDVDHDYKLAEPLVEYNDLLAALKSSIPSPPRQWPSDRQRRMATAQRLCKVFLVADYLFYKNAGKEDFTYTIRYINMLLSEASHVIAQHDFSDFSTGFSSIGFVVGGVTIYQTSSQDPFYGSELSVDDVLSTLADQTWDRYCIVHLLTYRDFQAGVVGLAYTAKTGSQFSGGICSQRVNTKDGMKNLNCGLSTGINYLEPLPRMLHSIVMAHELGHSLGSGHDTEGLFMSRGEWAVRNFGQLYCPYKNFKIMSTSLERLSTCRDSTACMKTVPLGDMKTANNKRFSQCSMTQIGKVLTEKGSCLTEYEPTCGNYIREEGEACDCGKPSSCEDSCCNPYTCKLVGGAQCSPAVGLSELNSCCTANCKYAPTSFVCRVESECTNASRCNGFSDNCPNVVPKPNGISCSHGLKTCQAGICSGSFCSRHGVSECRCAEDGCDVCCVYENRTCLPVQAWVHQEKLTDVTSIEMFLTPGTPCNNYQGYCTTDGVCDEAGSKDALDRLNQQVESWLQNQLENAPAWMKDNWYWIVVIVLVLVVVSILGYALCCYRRGASSADDELVTMDLKTLKATLAEGGEADQLTGFRRASSPKTGREKSHGDSRHASSTRLGDRNSLEAADGSSSKLSDDELKSGRNRSGSFGEGRRNSRSRARARRSPRSISHRGSSPRGLSKSPSKASSEKETNPLHTTAKSAAKPVEGAHALGDEHPHDVKRGRRPVGPKVNVRPSDSGAYYGGTERDPPRHHVTAPWSRELDRPVLSGVFKSRQQDPDIEEPYHGRNVSGDAWRGHRRQFSDSESENYRVREVSSMQGRPSQQYPRGRRSPLQLRESIPSARMGEWERHRWPSGGRYRAQNRNPGMITMSDTEMSDDTYGSGYKRQPRRRGRKSSTPNSTVRPSASNFSLSDAPHGGTTATALSQLQGNSKPQESLSHQSSVRSLVVNRRGSVGSTSSAEFLHYGSSQQQYPGVAEPNAFSFNRPQPIGSQSVSSTAHYQYGQPRGHWDSPDSYGASTSRPIQVLKAARARGGAYSSDVNLTADV